jgi:hypothetical protein
MHAERLKPKTAKLLGLDPKTTYSEALLHCRFVYTRRLDAWRGKPKDPVDCWEAHHKNVAA